MRGRLPAGPEYVDNLEGSPQAKERLKVILETIAGTRRVQEACAVLKISEPRFHQLREEAMAAALQGLEPRPAGRPPSSQVPAEQVQALEEKLAEKEEEVRAAQVRAEVALALPKARQEEPRVAEKKTRRPKPKQRWSRHSPDRTRNST